MQLSSLLLLQLLLLETLGQRQTHTAQWPFPPFWVSNSATPMLTARGFLISYQLLKSLETFRAMKSSVYIKT